MASVIPMKRASALRRNIGLRLRVGVEKRKRRIVRTPRTAQNDVWMIRVGTPDFASWATVSLQGSATVVALLGEGEACERVDVGSDIV